MSKRIFAADLHSWTEPKSKIILKLVDRDYGNIVRLDVIDKEGAVVGFDLPYTQIPELIDLLQMAGSIAQDNNKDSK